jgi:hypothetical protein
MAEDSKLRQAIRVLAKRESMLLDASVSAEVQREIKNKVMAPVKAKRQLLEEESGIAPSLTDAEIQEQLELVTSELKSPKISFFIVLIRIGLFLLLLFLLAIIPSRQKHTRDRAMRTLHPLRYVVLALIPLFLI